MENLINYLNRIKIYIICIVVTSLLIIVFLELSSNQGSDYGHIVYIGGNRVDDVPYSSDLYLMDGDGNRAQKVDVHVNGPAALSQDGRFIAYGCMKSTNICIIDTTYLIDFREYPLPYHKDALTLASPNMHLPSIKMPDKCEIPENSSNYGFHSLDWSGDGTKLAVVCGDGIKNVVCIVPLEGDANCWDKEALDFPIEVAAWSPRDDMLVVSGGGGGIKPSIYLMDDQGNEVNYVTDGWSPAFSPDGKMIAFFRWADNVKWNSDGSKMDDELKDFAGLSIINIDGSGERWVYNPLSPDSTALDEIMTASPFCQISWTCKITWSPNGRYLAFSANSGMGIDIQIYRLNLHTDEIVYLTYHISTLYASPDWGP